MTKNKTHMELIGASFKLHIGHTILLSHNKEIILKDVSIVPHIFLNEDIVMLKAEGDPFPQYFFDQAKTCLTCKKNGVEKY
jgi:hypothetical protein